MKAELKLIDGKIELHITSENATESIALQAWSDKYFPEKDRAYLLINLVAEAS